eukprot:6156623-Amphidinium_carterae.1
MTSARHIESSCEAKCVSTISARWGVDVAWRKYTMVLRQECAIKCPSQFEVELLEHNESCQ